MWSPAALIHSNTVWAFYCLLPRKWATGAPWRSTGYRHRYLESHMCRSKIGKPSIFRSNILLEVICSGSYPMHISGFSFHQFSNLQLAVTRWRTRMSSVRGVRVRKRCIRGPAVGDETLAFTNLRHVIKPCGFGTLPSMTSCSWLKHAEMVLLWKKHL